jgi:carbamoyl-phosphate synthase small subunit
MKDALQRPSAILMLEDGTVWRGNAVGKIGTTTGEICFNTGMTGYQEIFTDPSYSGQLLVSTSVHIGNYGTKKSETESNQIKIAGLICKNFNVQFSRTQADTDIQSYFEAENIVGISDVDTRAIVRHIRSKGAMNAIISSEIFDENDLKIQLSQVPSMDGLELSSVVSTTQTYTEGDESTADFRVAVLDYGVKRSILHNLTDRNCFVKVFPAKTNFAELALFKPNGYFISNGPGDPAAMDYAVETVRQILETRQPLFGICLGHQLLARALGVPTYKMHNGHRGINHPVLNVLTGRCEVTSQNHGFGIDPVAVRSKSETIEITHINLNDDTVEGIRLRHQPAFSVQYHPEASPGPHDSRYLFDDFVRSMADNLVEKSN